MDTAIDHLRRIVQLDDAPEPGLASWHMMRDKAHRRAKEFLESAAPVAPAATAPSVPEGYAIVPDYRGYAHLGIGQYVLNYSGEKPAELIISVATDAEKAGRAIGELRDNPDGHVLQPEHMCVRIRFENTAGLDALEQQLRFLREEHFPSAEEHPDERDTEVVQPDTARLTFVINKQGIVISRSGADGVRRYQLYQICEYGTGFVLSGKDRWFHTPREAIDAARKAQEQS